MSKKAKRIVFSLIGILILWTGVFLYLDNEFGGMLTDIFFDRPEAPPVKHAEFPFKLTIEYDGDIVKYEDVIICEYLGIEYSVDGGARRDWQCYIPEVSYGQYYLDHPNYSNLYIQVPLIADYYLGLEDAQAEYTEPYIVLIDDATGTNYYEQDLSDLAGVKIISWEIDTTIE